MFSDFLFLHAADCPNCLTKAIVMFLLALLLGLILGWILWGRFLSRMKQAEKERDDYHKRLTETEKDFASLQYKYDELNKESGTFRSQIGKLEADKAVLHAQMGRLRKELNGEASGDPDDLKIIEGVGPKIEKLLYEAGFRTYEDLAHAAPARIKEILDAAGPAYKLADPNSWPQQAKLAAEGKWDELKELKDKLTGGR